MDENVPMEPPTKRWKTDVEGKRELARELAINSLFLNDITGSTKYFLTDTDIPDQTPFKDLKDTYEKALQDKKIYETNHILNLIYYPFTSEIDKEESTTQEENLDFSFDPKIFFILHFRQYFRMIRRLVYFTYIQQGMIEECTRFDFKELKLHHKFYDSKFIPMTRERSDFIARGMHMEEYVRYHEINPFNIQEVGDVSETESDDAESDDTELTAKKQEVEDPKKVERFKEEGGDRDDKIEKPNENNENKDNLEQ